mmetsp:Transcript_25467/g.95988  ORF Transcript_25467/g.95988 Transcript_25467/m.95988 type:complete len:234 (-) Transcript_25467:1313-2014(-)
MRKITSGSASSRCPEGTSWKFFLEARVARERKSMVHASMSSFQSGCLDASLTTLRGAKAGRTPVVSATWSAMMLLWASAASALDRPTPMHMLREVLSGASGILTGDASPSMEKSMAAPPSNTLDTKRVAEARMPAPARADWLAMLRCRAMLSSLGSRSSAWLFAGVGCSTTEQELGTVPITFVSKWTSATMRCAREGTISARRRAGPGPVPGDMPKSWMRKRVPRRSPRTAPM